MHWADALPIGDLRLLIGVYSATILILAAVVDERQLGRRRVTELRASEATLIENEKYFRTLANSAPVMMWVSGPNKLRVFCNKSWLEFTGRSLEQETGYGWTAALHPEDLDRSLATYVSSFDARRDYQSEARVRRADGEYRWILDRGVPLYREGRFAGYIGGCLDITEQKLFTDRLTASEARLRDAQRLAKVGHWARDVKTDTIVWSDEMNHILGVENGAPMGFKEFLECVHTRDRQKIEDCDRRVHASALPVEVEYRIRRRGGSIRQVRSIVEGIRNDRGELVSIVGATHDITEAVNTEEEMRRIRAALATAREDESSRIARDLHDDITLRLTLLAVALREAAAAPARQPEALVANLHSSQKEIFEICEGLRQISHQLHPSILNDVGLAMAIESLCDDFSERGGLPVWFHCGKLPPNIPPHVSSCLYRITQEALRNVVKHAHAPEVSVTLKRLGSAMELCIVDSGIGFDASVKRAGLGVQGMRERVTTVNGAFSIESNPGSGTRIVVRVPLRAERAQTSRQEQSGVAN
jgi:PAS domain S-box-containing protein